MIRIVVQKYETQFREDHNDKNPFLKIGKTETNNTNHRNHPNNGRNVGNPNVNYRKCSSYKTQMNNRYGSRPHIPFHERPYRRNYNRQECISLRNNSFIGYGSSLSEIRYHKMLTRIVNPMSKSLTYQNEYQRTMKLKFLKKCLKLYVPIANNFFYVLKKHN
jgi:hypothetical protein